MARRENNSYKINEPLLTKGQREQLDALRQKVNDEKGGYYDFYSISKKYCNDYEKMMRSHGVEREKSSII